MAYDSTRETVRTRSSRWRNFATWLALGFLLCVFQRSRSKEAAYLFLQWLNSPEISLERVMLPYALRDPFRISHISSPKYRARWPAAKEYLDTLGAAATLTGNAFEGLEVAGACQLPK